MAKQNSGQNDFEYSGSNPSDVVYEQEAPVRSGRVGVATLVTTSVLVAVGLVGGAAFALSQAAQSTTVGGVEPVDNPSPVAAVPAASAPATPDASAASPSATPRLTGKTIAVPPAAFEDNDGDRSFHPAPPAGGAAGAGPVPSANPSAPSFGGGKGDHGDSGRPEGEHHKPRPTAIPTPGSSAAPNFGNGSDDGQDDD